MTNKKFVVKLSGEERGRLNELISKGKAKAKTILKARILLKADQGKGARAECVPLVSSSPILKARILLKADQGKGARAGPTRRFAARSTPTLRW